MSERDMANSDGAQVELTPDQPAEVERAVSELIGAASDEVDPWWQAGLDDALA
jgi:hypothetical protein